MTMRFDTLPPGCELDPATNTARRTSAGPAPTPHVIKTGQNAASDAPGPVPGTIPHVGIAKGAAIERFIAGEPIPQGSIRSVGRPGQRAVLISDNPRLKRWRKTIVTGLSGAQQIPGSVSVEAEFVLPRLSGHPKTAKGREYPACTKPDLDKLSRALGDALESAGVIENDSRIVRWQTSKRYAAIGEAAGVCVRIAPDGMIVGAALTPHIRAAAEEGRIKPLLLEGR